MPMWNDKSEIVDNLLDIAIASSLTLTALMAPNALQIFDKPLQKYYKSIDAQKREKELRQILRYMQRTGLVTGSYEHGLEATDKARKRLEKRNIDALTITMPKRWDRKWRIIFYDIPEAKKSARDALAFRLRVLGCQQLQRSVWVHPYPCEDEITTIAIYCEVEQYATFLEVAYINNQSALLERFKHLKVS